MRHRETDTHTYVRTSTPDWPLEILRWLDYVGHPGVLRTTTRQTEGTIHLNTSNKWVTMHPADRYKLLVWDWRKHPLAGDPQFWFADGLR